MIHTVLINLLWSARILMFLNSFIKQKAFLFLWCYMETRLNQDNVKTKKHLPDLEIYNAALLFGYWKSLRN